MLGCRLTSVPVADEVHGGHAMYRRRKLVCFAKFMRRHTLSSTTARTAPRVFDPTLNSTSRSRRTINSLSCLMLYRHNDRHCKRIDHGRSGHGTVR